MWNFLGGLVSGVSNLFGGAMNANAQEDINAQNIAAQTAINNQNIAEQEKFAQSGIQWRVADAAKAGINPLAALGASTGSFSNLVAPQSIAPQPGAGLAGFGQNIGRAMQAMQSPEDQAIAAEKTRLDLESGQLDNDLKRAQLASSARLAMQPGTPPGVDSDARKLVHFPSDTQVFNGPAGASLAPSAEFQRSTFGNTEEMNAWWYRNVLPQMFGWRIPPDVAGAGPGRAKYLNPLTHEYYDAPTVRRTKRGGLIDTTGMYDPFGLNQ